MVSSPALPAAQPEAELTPAPAPQPEPVLPAVFRGCWRGVVEEVDRIQWLPGARCAVADVDRVISRDGEEVIYGT